MTVLAIIVSMLAVRVTGTRDKQISLMSDQLADLLMVYAMRSEHSPSPIGISSIASEWPSHSFAESPPSSKAAR